MKNLWQVSFFMLASMIACDDEDEDDPIPENPADMPYTLTIDPANFETSSITGNDFFPLASGKVFTYEGESEDGTSVRVVTEWTTDTRVIAGVTCVITHDQEYEDDELVEDTFDWYAQDKDGNVWYFGEDTRELEDGEVAGTEGSWESGVDGALPGIIMLAKPIIGVWYRQEYYDDVAEDVGQVLALDASVTVPYGQFDDCLKTAEWNLLEPGIVENKYYAQGLGLIKTMTVKGDPSYEELVSVE